MKGFGGHLTKEHAPTVSVVMPSFNQADFLPAAVESVLRQTFDDIELIVMDGGSTDGSLQVLERLACEAGGRLRWYSEKDEGAADAINKALRLARGEYIGWLNSDDLYEDGAVERAVAYLAKRPECVMVYGQGRHIDERDRDVGTYPTHAPPLSAELLRNACPICQPTVFFRRAILNEVGLLDPTLSVAFDFEYWLRISKRYPKRLGFIEEVQAYSRLHSACKTVRQRLDVALECMRVIAASVGSAPAHWFYTWLDEYFAEFPFAGQQLNARLAMAKAIQEARAYLGDDDQPDFDRRLREDRRLQLLQDDACLAVYPDGWIGPRGVLRVRSSGTLYRAVRLQCRHASPTGAALTIRASSSFGQITETIVSEPGNFSMELLIPAPSRCPAYWSFTIDTEGAFVPAESEANSADTRALAFLVHGVELEPEVRP